MKPLVLLLFSMSFYVKPIYCYRKCTEEIEKQNFRSCNFICTDYEQIVHKTIRCVNISADYLQKFKESEENAPSYPLTINVSDSDIQVLPPSTFQYMKNATLLVLVNINLRTILPGAFNFLGRIKEIRLSQNEMTAIPHGIFNSLTTLETLDLSRNKLSIVSDHAFTGISLYHLRLNNNHILELSEPLLNSLTNLFYFDISQNNLTYVSSFHIIPAKIVNLSYNNIKTIDFVAFQNVDRLDISFNKITKTTNFSLCTANFLILSHNQITYFDNSDVSELDVSYNKLVTLDNEMFGQTLSQFHASYNSISSLSPGVFFDLYNLTDLFLDNNNLSSIPNSCFRDLSSLVHLNLSGNKLAYFNFGTFDNLISLNVLDISNNNFKEIPQYTFHSIGELRALFFQNNKITDIDMFDLVEHVPYLRELDLNYNMWSCKKLVRIAQIMKSRRISFVKGKSWDQNNIYGVRCYEDLETTNVTNTTKSKITYKVSDESNEMKHGSLGRKDISFENLERKLEDRSNFTTHYTVLFYITIILLFLILCVITATLYRLRVSSSKYNFRRKEEVELI